MKGRIYRNRLPTDTQVKKVWEPLSYINALLLVTVLVRFFVCVCVCVCVCVRARACVRVCQLHKVIYLFIYTMFECFLPLLSAFLLLLHF
jgi:hypothetical protein